MLPLLICVLACPVFLGWQYIRRHVNLFSVPHTVTEDLARQPGVAARKISPASVREFLRRSPGDIARQAAADYFGHVSAGGARGGGGSTHGSAGSASPPPDIHLLLELLDFCLSDCCPPDGDRPPSVSVPLTSGAPEAEASRTEGGDREEVVGGEAVEAMGATAKEAEIARQVSLCREGV